MPALQVRILKYEVVKSLSNL